MVHLTSEACSVLAIIDRDYGAPCSMLAEPASGVRVHDGKIPRIAARLARKILLGLRWLELFLHDDKIFFFEEMNYTNVQ